MFTPEQSKRLIFNVMQPLKAKTGGELALRLGAHRDRIYRVMRGEDRLSANLALAILERTGWTVAELKQRAEDKCEK